MTGVYQNLLFEQQQELAIITINRPEVLNALNQATIYELEQALIAIEQMDTVAAVIITGAGNKSFVAGADIGEIRSLSALKARSWGRYTQSVFNRLENLPKPVIAAINGFALGGGCELAMSCDLRIAATTARLGQPEVLLGVTPGYAGTQRLPRLIGKGRAKELIFTGDQIDAAEAYRIGLVNKVVPLNELLATAKEVATKISARGRIAVTLAKAAINEGMDTDFESGQAYEAEVFGLCFATLDQQEGMAAFVEKRKPQFTGT